MLQRNPLPTVNFILALGSKQCGLNKQAFFPSWFCNSSPGKWLKYNWLLSKTLNWSRLSEGKEWQTRIYFSVSLGKPDNRITAEPKRKSAAEKRINSFKNVHCVSSQGPVFGGGCWVFVWGDFLAVDSMDMVWAFLCLLMSLFFASLQSLLVIYILQWSVISLLKQGEDFSPLKQSPNASPAITAELGY